MPRKTKSEIEQALLNGLRLTWAEGAKTAGLELTTPVRRRLFSYLLNSKVRAIQGLPQDFIGGLSDAFKATDDPAAAVTRASSPKVAGPWRLVKIQTEGFGGVNTWSGGSFTYELGGDSLVLDGANGSGKSSLTGALIWALTGQRPREAGATSDAAANSQVYNDEGKHVGDWPPLACYPDKVGTLSTNPFVEVKLTFKNPAGDEAVIERSLKNGAIYSATDPRLELPPILIETGLVMPARLAQIRFGPDQKQLKDAVQMLTGLDEIASLGQFVADLCHKSYDYLGYSKKQKREETYRAFTIAIQEARDALQSVGRSMTPFEPADTQDKDGPMAALSREVSEKATETLAVIQSDLATGLDLSKPAIQQQVASAITSAKSEMTDGLSGLGPWPTLVAIAHSLGLESAEKLRHAVDAVKEQMNEAIQLRQKALDDKRFQMKAVAAAWHRQHTSGSIENCPLCEQSLNLNKQLAQELDALQVAGVLAQRKFEDNVRVILTDLDAATPSAIKKYRGELPSLQPKKALEAALRTRFVDHAKYSGCLTGLARVVGAAIPNLPADELEPWSMEDDADLPADSMPLREGIAAAERLLALSDWFIRNEPLWQSWWDQVTGEKLSPLPMGSFAGNLIKLNDALLASAPYRTARKGLQDAWKTGVAVDEIDVEQKRRQRIADEKRDLVDVDVFVAGAELPLQGAFQVRSQGLDHLLLLPHEELQRGNVGRESGGVLHITILSKGAADLIGFLFVHRIFIALPAHEMPAVV